MVIAITLLGVLAMAAVPMLRLPMNAYMDTQRRADAMQSLDMVHTKLEADLAQALPGSVRVRQVGARWLLEYLEVRAVGRHRAGTSGAAQACPATCSAVGNNDALEAGCSEGCFTALGALDGAPPVPGTDWVVVNPTGAAGGNPWLGGAAVVPGGIKSRLLATAAAADGLRLSITPHSFASLAASRRFWVVSQPVTWECNPATGRIVRYWGYALAAAQPAAIVGGNNAPVADGLAACRFSVNTSASEGRSSVSAWFRLTRNEAALGSTESAELAGSYEIGMR
jgi:MSHA biogenesis protein MshO